MLLLKVKKLRLRKVWRCTHPSEQAKLTDEDQSQNNGYLWWGMRTDRELGERLLGWEYFRS